jgi:hypothetical protein
MITVDSESFPGYVGHGWTLLERTIETSGQLVIRIAVATIFALATAASLVAAGILSTLIYPFVGLRQRAPRVAEAGS